MKPNCKSCLKLLGITRSEDKVYIKAYVVEEGLEDYMNFFLNVKYIGVSFLAWIDFLPYMLPIPQICIFLQFL